MEKMTKLVAENGVVIFSKSSCCLCYTLELLFRKLGVKPRVHELDSDPEMEKAIAAGWTNSTLAILPAVFIQGKHVGSNNQILYLHLSGDLTTMLKPYQTIN